MLWKYHLFENKYKGLMQLQMQYWESLMAEIKGNDAAAAINETDVERIDTENSFIEDMMDNKAVPGSYSTVMEFGNVPVPTARGNHRVINFSIMFVHCLENEKS